jgi:Family of unknown function (DUF5681)
MNEISKNLRPWKKGRSGNPAGRPIGSRQKIAEYIIRDIAADWQVNGVAALAELAKTDVAAYCKLAAGLIPKEFNLALASPMPGGLEPDDWALALEVFSAIKASLPDAADRRPGEVLEFVSGAIRAAGAKQLIELEPDANTMARADSEMLRGDSE